MASLSCVGSHEKEPDVKTVCKPVFDAQFALWRSFFVIALMGGLWLVPVVYLAVPENLPFKQAAIAVAALSGGVAAFLAFFVGMSAGARLPR